MSDSLNNDTPKRTHSSKSSFQIKSTGTIAQKCESKHNLFNGSCQNQGTMYHTLARKDRGDQKVLREYEPNRQYSSQSHACGDCFDSSYRSIASVDNTKQSINIQYKNVCFQDSESSYSSDEHDVTDLIECRHNIFTRPNLCPIVKCAKVITPDSILQHFCFEHSKVPRIHLEVKKPRHVTLFTNNLTFDAACLAVFLKEAGKRSTKLYNANSASSISSLYKYANIDPLFLMVSKISIKNNGTADNSNQNTSNAKTEMADTLLQMKESDEVHVSKNIKIKSNHINSKEALLFDEDEVLLLWISEINYLPKTYKITVSSDDRKHSHSYTGNSVHIKDKKDALTIYKRSECLAINGTAVNRLFNYEMSMQVTLKAIN